jgi:Zn-dependent metalloprotease
MASVPMVQQSSKLSTPDFSKVVRKISENGWVYFNDNFKPDPKIFFSKYMKDFGLSNNDEMRLINEESDSIYKFYHFQHYHKGLLVEGSSMALQFKDSNAVLAFGSLAKNMNLDIRNSISPEFALEIAKKKSNAKSFAWESNKMENNLKKELKDSSATYLPKPKLIITRANKGEFVLAFKIPVLSVSPKFDNADYYINANDGSLIKKIDQFYDAWSTGKVYYYTEDKGFTTYFVNGFPSGHWRLQDQTRGLITAKLNQGYILVGYDQYGQPLYYYDWNSYNYLDDWDNYWDWLSERPTVSALWAAEKCYDYFHSKGRDGTDDNNRELRLSTMDPNFNAGYWYNQYQSWDDIVTGFVNDTSLAALDVIGHEYTHAVTRFTAGFLNTPNHSSALNEGFSDIFGEVIEWYVDGSCDWKVAGDFFAMRSFDNPHESHTRYGIEYGQLPNHVTDPLWYDGANANTYSHTNCGVVDYWFYLLVNGNSQLGVTGIGMQAASNIAFTTLTSYLFNTPDATFAQAREASENSATYHYGLCSNVYQQVQNAWAAVGVGDPATCTLLEVSSIYVNPYPACAEYCNFSVNASGGNGTISYEWYVNDALISTYSSMSYYFPEYYSGSYNITLHVTDGNQNVYRYDTYYISCGDYLIESENSITMSVYPNPATDQATIRIFDDKKAIDDFVNSDYNISIVDNSGRILYKTKTKSNELNINLGDYQKGTYSLIITRGKYKGSSLIIKK